MGHPTLMCCSVGEPGAFVYVFWGREGQDPRCSIIRHGQKDRSLPYALQTETNCDYAALRSMQATLQIICGQARRKGLPLCSTQKPVLLLHSRFCPSLPQKTQTNVLQTHPPGRTACSPAILLQLVAALSSAKPSICGCCCVVTSRSLPPQKPPPRSMAMPGRMLVRLLPVS